MAITKLTQPLNDFAVARMFGARSALTFAENAAARARSEEGGVGMQAAVISGGLVVIAIAVVLVLGQAADDTVNTLAAANLTLPATQAIGR